MERSDTPWEDEGPHWPLRALLRCDLPADRLLTRRRGPSSSPSATLTLRYAGPSFSHKGRRSSGRPPRRVPPPSPADPRGLWR